MTNAFNLKIVETQQDLVYLLNQQTLPVQKDRVVALYLLKLGRVQSVQELSKTLGRNPTTIRRWLQVYRLRGLQGLI